MTTQEKPPKRRWWNRGLPRFSLSTLLILVLLAASGFGLWWRWEPWTVEQIPTDAKEIYVKVAFSPDGKQISEIRLNPGHGSIRVLRTSDKAVLWHANVPWDRLGNYLDSVYLEWSPDSQWLTLITEKDQKDEHFVNGIWNAEDGQEMPVGEPRALPRYQKPPYWSPNGRFLPVGRFSTDIYDPKSQTWKNRNSSNPETLMRLFCADESALVEIVENTIPGEGQKVQAPYRANIYADPYGDPTNTFELPINPDSPCESVLLSPDGKQLAVVSDLTEQLVQVLSVADGSERYRFSGQPIVFLEDGELVAVQRKQGLPTYRLVRHDPGGKSVTFDGNLDGDRFLSFRVFPEDCMLCLVSRNFLVDVWLDTNSLAQYPIPAQYEQEPLSIKWPKVQTNVLIAGSDKDQAGSLRIDAVSIKRKTSETSIVGMYEMDHALSPDGEKILLSCPMDSLLLLTQRRPSQLIGLAWLPEFWLTAVFGLALVWSLVRDFKTLRRAPA